ncbi:MAG: AraC family transcriptional regulator N-terminal domain-containing protein [Roseateles asaccharophilus]|uniref:AraC family transcriptional regulator n=1 Tax=Roseateles asaccharophilus TaxID=582607 RepID=UPI00391DB09A
MTPLDTFRDAIARHAAEDGTHVTPLPGTKLIRCSSPTLPMPVIYEPTVCFVAQGRKRAVLGETVFHYDPRTYLVASVALPIMGTVVEASAELPYLSVQLDLDPVVLGEIALRLPRAVKDDEAVSGLTLNEMTPGLVDAVTRLVRLLDEPQDMHALAPIAMQEIFYRLLSGPNGGAIHAMTQLGSRHAQVARAILWIRAHFSEGFRIDDLAEMASMSRSTFHEHFKAVTAMTPLEYRTQLRLQEARRLMVSEGLDAGNAGFRVGYESPSQFSRDYSRLFGLPPGKDADRLRMQTVSSRASAAHQWAPAGP